MHSQPNGVKNSPIIVSRSLSEDKNKVNKSYEELIAAGYLRKVSNRAEQSYVLINPETPTKKKKVDGPLTLDEMVDKVQEIDHSRWATATYKKAIENVWDFPEDIIVRAARATYAAAINRPAHYVNYMNRMCKTYIKSDNETAVYNIFQEFLPTKEHSTMTRIEKNTTKKTREDMEKAIKELDDNCASSFEKTGVDHDMQAYAREIKDKHLPGRFITYNEKVALSKTITKDISALSTKIYFDQNIKDSGTAIL